MATPQMCERDFVRHVVSFNIGRIGLDEVRGAIRDRIQDRSLIPAHTRDREKDPLAIRYTTPELIDREKQLLRFMRKGRGVAEPIVPQRDLDGLFKQSGMAPDQMKTTMKGLYDGCMEGRTMYVIPFMMGPGGSLSQIGVQLSDSPYVVVSMHIMARVGFDKLDLAGHQGPGS